MKKIYVLALFITCYFTSQSQINGIMYNYKTKKAFSFSKSDALFFIINSNTSGPLKITVDTSGQFSITKDLFDKLDSFVSISISSFHSSLNSLGDTRFQNIPREKLKLLLEEFYLAPAYYINLSKDWEVVDNKKTYRIKHIKISNGKVEYSLRRDAKKIKKLNAISYVGTLY